MYDIIKKNWDRAKNFTLFIFVLFFFLLIAVVYKNSDIISTGEKEVILKHEELNAIKEFLLKKINAPFINVSYEIKKGDSIQQILKKYKVKNSEIQNIINQYKKICKSQYTISWQYN